jgi:plasmid stability protein
MISSRAREEPPEGNETMAQLLVRNLEDDVKEKLQARARTNGRSTEEEVRQILREAVLAEPAAAGGLGTRAAARFRGKGLNAAIEELRGQSPKPAEFGK